ncbi:ABC transporter substrate-binding protein [Bosea sp. (in: a-proteobacteria)]|uniref:ABC transporter substrate-binding protein n=1 Tax=Bosea sp. (in: a-proteobacteria) TaxID=1871050 RepID=UPI00260C6658|nr:ABC transporter substrate-binding protein [Bosea sp. (in: a-proteobacteria)]MCO5090337.1 ABC transporter substrate-binding protein [Bosea sp. (in: a-proteobacteria)]
MINRRIFVSGAGALAMPAVLRSITANAQSLEPVTFRFNWSWVGNYAPVVLGFTRGYFKEQGIDLKIGQGKGSGATVRQVGTKNDQFVWADTSALLVGAAQGIPVTGIMVIAYSNLGILWVDGKTRIDSPKDIIGKKISATPGDGNTQMWPAVLAANNIKPDQVEMVFLDGSAAIAALREGRVDVALGGVSDQPVTLRNAGVNAKSMSFADMGVKTLGSGVMAHPDTVKDKPDLCARMVRAVQKSWEAGLKEPQAAVDALTGFAETPLNGNIIKNGLAVFQGLRTGETPTGFINPASMESTLAVLKQYGGVKTDLPATAFYTNQFVKS